jgi:(4S)-4-hydroxy-5-phosphonooxypentane-2,3-dione isomerase
MHIVLVYIHVNPNQVESFTNATKENAEKSSKLEPGVVRFDVLQQVDDPTRFVLIEEYRSNEAAALHKETSHYKNWREIAEPIMAEPRTRVIYKDIYPEDN